MLAFLVCLFVLTQWQAQSTPSPLKAVQTQATDTQKANVQQYVELLGSNVQQEKAQIMGAVLQLNKEEAEKFWPIYNEYEAELTKLNQQRTENIQEYAHSYSQLTNDRANELVKAELDAMKQRTEMMNKYHERVKESLGPVNAARFFEIDSQLNSIIDLQIDSSLPVGQD
jgi:tRNA nucleotidyltransferase/poly(A) polymerase